MNLQLYNYNCINCGNTFKEPELPGDPYGEFLMRSETGQIAYLPSFRDIVFQEIEDFFKKNKNINNKSQISRVKIFHEIFGITCDAALDGSKYQIGKDPFCPNCHLNNNLSWSSTNPPEMVELHLKTITHNYWNSLDKQKKEKILNAAIKMYL